MAELGITESFSVKRQVSRDKFYYINPDKTKQLVLNHHASQVLVSASEAAEMILRVDDIIRAAPRKREVDRGHC